MKPTHQLARAAAVFFTQFPLAVVSDEYRVARDCLLKHRAESPELVGEDLLEMSSQILAQYVLSIPDQFEEGRRAGYAEAQPQAEQNPMPSLFERFGK